MELETEALLALIASVMISRSCVRVGSATSWSRTYLRRNNNYTQFVNTRARVLQAFFELRNDFRFRAPLKLYH